MIKPQSLLLVLNVPFRKEGNRLLCEVQAFNGLERWADHFDSVVLAAPVLPPELSQQEDYRVWRDVRTLTQPDRFEFLPLPWAYRLPNFLRFYRRVRSQLAEQVARCEYLQFGTDWLVGDWSVVAALEAIRQNKPYAIHKDVVSHELHLQTAKGKNLAALLKAHFTAALVEKGHEWLIRRAKLGLWHGADCFEAYSDFCPNSYLVHDIHTKRSDLISASDLESKQADCLRQTELRICYVGRMVPMKAPVQWVKAIGEARKRGVNLKATWIGDGALWKETEAMIAHLGLESCIELVGFESNYRKVLQKLQAAHVMVFTHITPESPRCLIEALINGTPIIGYESRYARDLVKGTAAGMFVPVGDWEHLGAVVQTIARNRNYLARMMADAARCGQRFSDEAVFQERSFLIKKHLGSRSLGSAHPLALERQPRPQMAADLEHNFEPLPDALSAEEKSTRPSEPARF